MLGGVSLLYRPHSAGNYHSIAEETFRDLGLSELLKRIRIPEADIDALETALRTAPVESADLEYRFQVIRELSDKPDLTRALEGLLPVILELHYYSRLPRTSPTGSRAPLLKAIWKLGELELYVRSLEELSRILDRPLDSAGLLALREFIRRKEQEPIFLRLKEELPKIKRGLAGRQSLTLGINLDDHLRPIEAVIISVNEERFVESGLAERLFGTGDSDYSSTVPLKRNPVPENPDQYPEGFFPLAPLFEDLDRIVGKGAQELKSRIGLYMEVETGFLLRLRREIGVLCAAVRFQEQLKELGMPTALPEFGAKGIAIRGLYNPHLVFRSSRGAQIIRNDFSAGGANPDLYLLTGPNQGGKTTYLQALGLVQSLANAGFPVPAEKAQLRAATQVLTHFPKGEAGNILTGRFDEEASRLAEIIGAVKQTDRASLLLLNEPLTSTSHGEAEEILSWILKGLNQLGARGIIATHLHGLARKLADRPAEFPGFGSLVARAHEKESGAVRTYRIESGCPSGRSYAKEIAERYGLTPDAIAEISSLRASASDPERADDRSSDRRG